MRPCSVMGGRGTSGQGQSQAGVWGERMQTVARRAGRWGGRVQTTSADRGAAGLVERTDNSCSDFIQRVELRHGMRRRVGLCPREHQACGAMSPASQGLGRCCGGPVRPRSQAGGLVPGPGLLLPLAGRARAAPTQSDGQPAAPGSTSSWRTSGPGSVGTGGWAGRSTGGGGQTLQGLTPPTS